MKKLVLVVLILIIPNLLSIKLLNDNISTYLSYESNAGTSGLYMDSYFIDDLLIPIALFMLAICTIVACVCSYILIFKQKELKIGTKQSRIKSFLTYLSLTTFVALSGNLIILWSLT